MKTSIGYSMLLLMVFVSSAQTPNFSQYYATGLYLNPALTGVEPTARFGLNYRSQWTQMDMSFITFQASFMYPLIKPGVRAKHMGGIGVSFFNDEVANGTKTSGGTASYAYNVHLNKYGNNLIAFGGQLGYYQLSFNSDNLQWSSQYNPDVGFDPSISQPAVDGELYAGYMVVNVGMMWYFKNKYRYAKQEYSFFNGFSVANVNRPDDSFIEESYIPMLLKVHGGMNLSLSARLSISPNYLMQYQEGNFQTNAGAYLSYSLPAANRDHVRQITFGTWYRLEDSFILSAGYISNHMDIGVSYDLNVSSFNRYLGTSGAFEFSIAYKFGRKDIFKRYATPMI